MYKTVGQYFIYLALLHTFFSINFGHLNNKTGLVRTSIFRIYRDHDFSLAHMCLK